MDVVDLFSGIGGFSLGLERAGFRTVAFCEIDPFARKLLYKHFPGRKIYEDVTILTAEQLKKDGIRPEVLTGGFPCQDISLAGKGSGIAGTRSGLWREYYRLIEELSPKWVIIENVTALLNRGMGVVLSDLHQIGYDAEWHCIPASYIGAPHRRDRIWIVAYPRNELGRRQSEIRPISNAPQMGNTHHPRLQGLWRALERARERSPWADGEILSGADGKERLCPPGVPLLAYGVPNHVDRIRGTGNAIVPLIAQAIGEAIKEDVYTDNT